MLNNGSHPIILFDGLCHLCDGSVQFVIRQDRQGIFRFAPLQSRAGEVLLEKFGLLHNPIDSFVLVYKGRAFTQSSAALQVLNLLPWYWKWTQVFRIVPPFIRNAVYRLIARNRYRWFGKRQQCMIPSPEVKSRFLES